MSDETMMEGARTKVGERTWGWVKVPGWSLVAVVFLVSMLFVVIFKKHSDIYNLQSQIALMDMKITTSAIDSRFNSVVRDIQAFTVSLKDERETLKVQLQEVSDTFSEYIRAQDNRLMLLADATDPNALASYALMIHVKMRLPSESAKTTYELFLDKFTEVTGYLTEGPAWQSVKRVLANNNGLQLREVWKYQLGHDVIMTVARDYKDFFASLERHPQLFTHPFPEGLEWHDALWGYDYNEEGVYTRFVNQAFGITTPDQLDRRHVFNFLSFLKLCQEEGGVGLAQTVRGITHEIVKTLVSERRKGKGNSRVAVKKSNR